MRYTLLAMLLLFLCAFSTQWQPASLIPPGDLVIGGPSFTNDNLRIYGDQWHDGYWAGDICYFDWNGSAWVFGGWVPGDVNTTMYDDEPFINYDGQHLYFTRWLYDGQTIYVADWDGSQFVNSRPLGPQINNGDNRYPSVTQDGMKLYYTGGSGSYFKIFESTWNGSDWNVGILMPDAVNSSGNRFDVTITPDGNEIYFTGGPYPSKLAFSRKIGSIWQQWQYCDSNINIPGCTVSGEALTYAPYGTQELYFARNFSPGTLTWHALRSPVSVEPASLGQIKANYR